VNGVLTVEVLTEGVHSGDASGVGADESRIARSSSTASTTRRPGSVKDRAFQRGDPRARKVQAKRAAAVLGKGRSGASFPRRRTQADAQGSRRASG
jgi:hypothetical protein